MSIQLVPLERLRSPKLQIDFRQARDNEGDAIAGDSFMALVRRYRNKEQVDPITVTPRGSDYYILDGVRRSVAALSAGVKAIPATVVPAAAAGAVMGVSVPLNEVRFTFDVRNQG